MFQRILEIARMIMRAIRLFPMYVAEDPLVCGMAPLDGLSVRVCRAAALPA